MHCLRTALCESIRYQAKSEQNVRQDLIPRVRHGEAALCTPAVRRPCNLFRTPIPTLAINQIFCDTVAGLVEAICLMDLMCILPKDADIGLVQWFEAYLG